MSAQTHELIRGSAAPMEGRCAAKLPNLDRYCTKYPLKGGRRCETHGQKGGRPPTHGRAAAWNRTLGATWEVLKREDTRDLSIGAKLMLAREGELRERLSEGDSIGFRVRAVDLMRAVRESAARGDGDSLRTSLVALESHLSAGADRDGVWAEILTVNERHAALVDRAVTIETRVGNCLTGKALVVLLGTIFDLVCAEAGERVAYRVGLAFDRVIAAELPAGPALQALPAFGADREDGATDLSE